MQQLFQYQSECDHGLPRRQAIDLWVIEHDYVIRTEVHYVGLLTPGTMFRQGSGNSPHIPNGQPLFPRIQPFIAHYLIT